MEEIDKPLSVLVVEDDPKTLAMFGRIVENNGAVCVLKSNVAAAKTALEERNFDMVLLDRKLPDGDGIDLIEPVKEFHPDALVIMVTAHGTIDLAVQAMKKGAWDFLSKPFCFERLEVLLARAKERFQSLRENERLRREVMEARLGEIIGSSPPIRLIKGKIAQVAPTPSTVLIQGETGVGKELAARALHRMSQRAEGPFITVDCAAIPETLLESTLFGHEKGAFTDAHATRKGMVELANGGTLFLDEIAEMALSLQAKLLRLLQERVYRPIGSEKEKQADIRVLSATRWDLDKRTIDGYFREDLYYRLNVITVTLPPLRERPGDIPILANHFLYRHSVRADKILESISEKTMEILRAYNWPGNVRELEHAIEHAVAVTDGTTVFPEHLPESIRESAPMNQNETMEDFSSRLAMEAAFSEVSWKDFQNSILQPYLDAFVQSLLLKHEGNISAAAKQAGLSRNGLYSLIRRSTISTANLGEQ